VVLVTLVGQGLTFGPLLRLLGLRTNSVEEAQVRNDARLAAVTAAQDAVSDMLAEHEITPEIAEELRTQLRHRTDRYRVSEAMLEQASGEELTWTPHFESLVAAQHAIIFAERQELLRWRDAGQLPDHNLRQLQHELDQEERLLPGS
jgi:CPA1 family monovalent cation:H+ antiporter